MKSLEYPTNHFKTKLRYFIIGILLGGLCSLGINKLILCPELTNIMSHEEELSILQAESNEKLLKYIEGDWHSSIGDLSINITNSSINSEILFIESLPEKNKTQKIYKLKSINKINGLLGIINLTICEEKTDCSNETIDIQINKIFGISKTIVMTYDSSFSTCLPITDKCSRAFKEK